MGHRRHVIAVAAAFTLGIGFGSVDISSLADGHGMEWLSGTYPPQYEASMEASSDAFRAKDMDATLDHMAEDFATYELHGEDAPKLLVKGREETVAIMKSFFSGDFGARWDGADVEKLGSIGNAMVQIEYDRYKYDDGIRTISTFVIIQYKNGKRWREWRLVPDPVS